VLIGYTSTALQGAAGGPSQLTVACRTLSKTVSSHGQELTLSAEACTAAPLAGPVTLKLRPGDLQASVSGGASSYATGFAVALGSGRYQVVLTDRIRALRAGGYTLTLRTRGPHPRVVNRTTITLT
jgi:hypothetical protein